MLAALVATTVIVGSLAPTAATAAARGSTDDVRSVSSSLATGGMAATTNAQDARSAVIPLTGPRSAVTTDVVPVWLLFSIGIALLIIGIGLLLLVGHRRNARGAVR
jgi:hypothetical protein